MTAVNATKLNDNLMFITENQEKWNQSVWADARTEIPEMAEDVPPTPGECGTAFCLAGWAVVRDGYELDWVRDLVRVKDDGTKVYNWSATRTKDGHEIMFLAQEILGLPDRVMFEGGNSLARLWTLGEQVTDNKIQRPSTAPKGNGTGGDDCDCDMCSDEYEEDYYDEDVSF